MDPFDGVDGARCPRHRLQRNQLNDYSADEHRAPERDDVRDIGIDSQRVEGQDQRARGDRHAHLANDVSHRAAVRSKVAAARSQDAAHHARGDDRCRKKKASGDGLTSFRIERKDDTRRYEGEEHEHAGKPPEPAMPRRSSLQAPRHEQQAKRKRQ